MNTTGHAMPYDELVARADLLREHVAAAATRSGRQPDDVRIMAVTKTIPPTTIQAAYDAGFRLFGENRVQEAQSKFPLLAMPDAIWELIGHLQTNKAARAVQLFSRVQSVDSLHLAQALDRRAGEQGKRLPVLLEVNVGGEESKSGFAPEELLSAAQAITRLPHLEPQGLMTIAPMARDPQDVRPMFRRLRELRDMLRERVPVNGTADWAELSMGMTDDYAVAIEEGSTLIRVGRGLFGARQV